MHLGRCLAALALCAPAWGRAASAAPAGAADIQTTPLQPAAEVVDPIIPLHIPGYELRILDRRKPVRFNVAGVWAESTLPIFIYVPTGDPGRAAGFLRKAYDGLLKLGLEPEWTAEELRAVLTNLDAAIRALEPGPEASPTADKAAQTGPQPSAK